MRALWVAGLLSAWALLAPAGQVELVFFGSATCPDCYLMKEFLAELVRDYPSLKVVEYEVTFHPENWRLMVTLARAYGLTREAVPMVFVGELGISGVGRAVELRIREEVERCLARGCPSPLARLPEKRARVLSPLELALILGAAVVLLLFLLR
ncbi:MAG: thioredoxin family protein [Candidatus Bipolaricaulota bacterium]|nr:thioredoxin family protein [Candidatus Bipolaricaulota bacterium]MCX7843899.1 thioredoxin family protein [Candidatus Bipolaricaulota bacterium]MDW8151479.1 thioredoxin family protein [Candidatus Bipolaricaulota bacterium]